MIENKKKYKEAMKYYGIKPLGFCDQLFNNNTHLPIRLHDAYRLCMTLHDEILKILLNGMKNEGFKVRFPINRDQQEDLENSDIHIIDWLKSNDFNAERATVIALTTLRAVLGDMTNCVFESLEMARKGKMSLAFMLIRKPIQEALFLIEEIILSPTDYLEKLEISPQKLEGTKLGGIEAHTKRLQKILEIVKIDNIFSSKYLAQIRYDKSSRDSFDGICNKSMHLFTNNKYIKTERMNINMIFSEIKCLETQFDFYFSRMVYILSYIYHISSFIGDEICPTTPTYKEHIENVTAALTSMWFIQLPHEYGSKEIFEFSIKITEKFSGTLTYKEYIKIIETGKYSEKQNFICLFYKWVFNKKGR